MRKKNFGKKMEGRVYNQGQKGQESKKTANKISQE